MGRWRLGTTQPPTAAGRLESYIAERELEPAATIVGYQPCSGLRCSSLAGMPCTYVDRRGRLCKTAWCPADRHVVNGHIFCALHAHTMRGTEWEFGTASHPDVDSRTVPIIQWISSAAADEVIAALNIYCALRGEMLVAEPVRRMFNPFAHSRVWEKQWKTLSPTDVTMRVSICADEYRPTEVRIKVNGHIVNVVPPPWNKELGTPTEADAEWLEQEVLAPIVAGVEQAMLDAQVGENQGGYMLPGSALAVEADTAVIAEAPKKRVNKPKTRVLSSVEEAALDEARRAHFQYGLEEIQSLQERKSASG